MISSEEATVGERYDELLEFVYLSPFALLRIDETGAIEMMNAMGANLLLQFSPTPQLENLFDILQGVAPEICAMVKGFAADRGTICRGYRLEARGDAEAEENTGPLVLALDLVKLGPRRIMAALHDISRLENAHRARRALLDTVSDGLVTVDAHGRMFGECSKALVRLLGAPEPGQYLWDYVVGAQKGPGTEGAARFADALALGWEQLVDDVLPLEVGIEQLPRSLEVGGIPLGVSYEPTIAQKKLVSMLFVVRDRTVELERERLDAEQRELIAAVSCLGRDRDGFREFIAEASRLVRTLVEVPDAEVTTILRVLHTLKGSASLVGVTSLASTCHELEDRLAGRDGGLTPDERVLLDEQWNVLRERFSLFLPEVGGDVVMSRDEHADLLRDVHGGASREAITRKLEALTLRAVQPQLVRLGEQAAALARRLEKGPLEVRVDGSGLRHPLRAFTPFWTALAHAVRNAVDHGIESVEERRAAGKPSGGRLELLARAVDDGIVVEVRDDGRGIDWPRLAEKARSMGFPSDSREDLRAALFRDGTSTREEVTEISGRGVGMGVLKEACDALGGRIEVESTPRVGTTLRFFFPSRTLREGPDPTA